MVLRVGSAQDSSPLRTEAAALQLAARHGVLAPRLLTAELDGDPPVVLTGRLAGSSTIPMERPAARLHTLGAAAAALHAIGLEPGPALPARDRPIALLDFAALRRQREATPLLVTAEQRIQDCPVPDQRVFVHGDLWQGNTLWSGDTLAGLVDWDCAGAGHPGVDLGSLRCDAAVCFGLQAADDVQQGWEQAAGRAAEAVAYWDVVAALSTPQTWAGSPRLSQARAALISAGSFCSGAAMLSSRPLSTAWATAADPRGSSEADQAQRLQERSA